MTKLVLMKGLPFSGKTEWALKWVQGGAKRIRISWSDILHGMGADRAREARVFAVDAALRMMCTALRHGYSVVLDEENLNPAEFSMFLARGQMHGGKVSFQVMKTPLEQCLKRNADMGHPISDLQIRQLSEKYSEFLK